jgi:hypothetical protein
MDKGGIKTETVEPKPIVWLGRGYMGDANDK